MTKDEFIKNRNEKISKLPKPKPESKQEKEFLSETEKHRVLVTRLGFPVYVCWLPDGKLSLVLIRPNKKEKLQIDAALLMAYLKYHRVSCYCWSPDANWLNKKKKEKKK